MHEHVQSRTGLSDWNLGMGIIFPVDQKQNKQMYPEYEKCISDLIYLFKCI